MGSSNEFQRSSLEGHGLSEKFTRQFPQNTGAITGHDIYESVCLLKARLIIPEYNRHPKKVGM